MALDGDFDMLMLYVNYIAVELDLVGWEFSIVEEPLVDDDGDSMITLAECRNPAGRRWAQIAFSEDWGDWSDHQLRHVVTHELIHCIVNPMREPVLALMPHVGQAAFTVANEMYRNNMERSVDHLAVAIAKKVDLPSTWLRRYNDDK